MVNIKNIPSSVAEHLSEEEVVIGKINNAGTDYFATNKRLLRFGLRIGSPPDFRTLEYKQMSIVFMKYGGVWNLLRGVLIFIAIYALVADITLFDEIPIMGSVAIWLAVLFVILSALVFIYGYYQIRAPDIDNNDLRKWRLPKYRYGSGSTDRFVETVKQKIVST